LLYAVGLDVSRSVTRLKSDTLTHITIARLAVDISMHMHMDISMDISIDREFEFYEFFSFLNFNEFYEFFFG